MIHWGGPHVGLVKPLGFTVYSSGTRIWPFSGPVRQIPQI